MRVFNCNEMISRYHPVTIRNPSAPTRPGRIIYIPPSLRPESSSFVTLRLLAVAEKSRQGGGADRGGGSVAHFASPLFAYASLTAGVSNVIVR